MKKLNPKQTRFVQEYLNPNGKGYFNATQAAILVGCKKKSARVQGKRLLTNDNIAAAILDIQKSDGNKAEMTRARWVAELIPIYTADMKDFVDIDPDTGAVQVKGYDGMPEGASRIIHTIEEKRSITEDEKGKRSIIYSTFKFKLHDKLRSGEMLGKHFGYLKDKIEGDINLNIRFDYDVENGNGKD